MSLKEELLVIGRISKHLSTLSAPAQARVLNFIGNAPAETAQSDLSNDGVDCVSGAKVEHTASSDSLDSVALPQ